MIRIPLALMPALLSVVFCSGGGATGSAPTVLSKAQREELIARILAEPNVEKVDINDASVLGHPAREKLILSNILVPKDPASAHTLKPVAEKYVAVIRGILNEVSRDYQVIIPVRNNWLNGEQKSGEDKITWNP